jgi:hypothetical protein
LGRATDWDQLTQRVLGLFDTPAYMRRALRVEDAVAALERRIEQQRWEWLEGVRRGLARWQGALERWPDASELLSGEMSDQLIRWSELAGRSDRPPAPELWPARPKRVLADLARTMQVFEERWERYLAVVDLDEVNRLIDDYNAKYLIEKECAFRSSRAAARGFRSMCRLDRAWLASRFPPLPRWRT